VLTSKIAWLEKRTGNNKPPAIPVEDGLHVIEGTTLDEIQKKKDKVKNEMLQKYGQRVLKELRYIIIRISSNETDESTCGQDKKA
jgi:tetrahydromethanopterin S-methyltransferase subunit G